ncbi:MAG: thiosulfate oxidation carrier protein SoxY [Betaproteobacteria bacterium RIFCSPLOWO2_12_FULL_65_14]|nr:MAG: thiosulfate oxidation carrier protein SoxY [Betaproteobacteria bacterium RIFCSPLOWO2_12_FULL_65_14]
MNRIRRDMIKAGGGASLLALVAAAGFVRLGTAAAAEWNKAAFEVKTVAEAFKALGAGTPANSADILMKAPDIAENGAVVPIGIESRIPGTESIAVLIEKNPNPLAASFDIPAGTETMFTTRVKMAETSNVYALVKANGKYFVSKKEIKVTLGGCGG